MPDPSSLQDVFDAMDHGVIAFDGDLTILAANDRAGSILNAPEEMIRPGADFEALIRRAASRGEYGSGDLEEIIAVHLGFACGAEANPR